MDEFNEIYDWLGKNFENLEFTEQLAIFLCFANCVKEIKPIYYKYLNEELIKANSDDKKKIINMFKRTDDKCQDKD